MHWSKISSEARDLVSRLITKGPHERLSAVEALEHDWFKKLETPNEEEKEIQRSGFEATTFNHVNMSIYGRSPVYQIRHELNGESPLPIILNRLAQRKQEKT
jgi:serine/threonine protein kinase